MHCPQSLMGMLKFNSIDWKLLKIVFNDFFTDRGVDTRGGFKSVSKITHWFDFYSKNYPNQYGLCWWYFLRWLSFHLKNGIGIFQAKSVQNFLTYFIPTLRVVWMQDLKNVRTVLEYTSGMLERALRTDSKYIHHRSNSAPSLKTVSIPNLPVALPGSIDIG